MVQIGGKGLRTARLVHYGGLDSVVPEGKARATKVQERHEGESTPPRSGVTQITRRYLRHHGPTTRAGKLPTSALNLRVPGPNWSRLGPPTPLARPRPGFPSWAGLAPTPSSVEHRRWWRRSGLVDSGVPLQLPGPSHSTNAGNLPPGSVTSRATLRVVALKGV